MAPENRYADDLFVVDHPDGLQRPQQGAPLKEPWSARATMQEITDVIRSRAPDAVVTSLGYGSDIYKICVQVPVDQVHVARTLFGPHVEVSVLESSEERTAQSIQQLTRQTFQQQISQAFPHMIHRVQHEELGWEGEVGYQRVFVVQGEYLRRMREMFPGENISTLTREEYFSELVRLPRDKFDQHMQMLVEERMSIMLPGVRFFVRLADGGTPGPFGMKLHIAVPAEYVEEARRLFPSEDLSALTQNQYSYLYPESEQAPTQPIITEEDADLVPLQREANLIDAADPEPVVV